MDEVGVGGFGIGSRRETISSTSGSYGTAGAGGEMGYIGMGVGVGVEGGLGFPAQNTPQAFQQQPPPPQPPGFAVQSPANANLVNGPVHPHPHAHMTHPHPHHPHVKRGGTPSHFFDDRQQQQQQQPPIIATPTHNHSPHPHPQAGSLPNGIPTTLSVPAHAAHATLSPSSMTSPHTATPAAAAAAASPAVVTRGGGRPTPVAPAATKNPFGAPGMQVSPPPGAGGGVGGAGGGGGGGRAVLPHLRPNANAMLAAQMPPPFGGAGVGPGGGTQQQPLNPKQNPFAHHR
mmetsp:Transcript_3994/g.10172  ORF Transcript_3994/g.10172 Transcript_3994/m.10172 type:complete len:288 (-) Transcript_3994:805-1668(-)